METNSYSAITMPSSLSPSSLILEGDSALHVGAISRYLSEYFQSFDSLGPNDEDGFQKVIMKPKPFWIKGMLAETYVHDNDYTVLSFLQNDRSIIIDAGANWGYSAGAFKKLGIKSKIVSFEVIKAFDPVLNELKSIYPDSYHYFIHGLGDEESEVSFWCPVINNEVETALCSASRTPHIPSLVQNILTFFNANQPAFGNKLFLQILEFTGSIRMLDNVIPAELPFAWRDLPIEAIKIDVEGFETKALRGGIKLIKKYKPLVLAESANRTPGISDLMLGLGYVFADNIDGVLKRNTGMGQEANGFFLHSDRLDEYKSMGVYAGD